MGLTSTARVITRSEYYGRRSVLQPGNHEWVTVVESIGASGWVLPPVIIFKGKQYQQAWFEELPRDWRFEVSLNGWTTDEIGLRWLEKTFIPATNSHTKGKYRLLILDGHGSHLTPQFDQICAQNNIISICMPPHSSHLLQPLDIGCFSPLKNAYGTMVDQKQRLGFNHIDKLDFLMAYPPARVEAFKSVTIQNSFAAAGLVPLNANRVISKLDIRLHTPTPPGSRPTSRSSIFSPKTPANVKELLKQASLIKDFLKQRSNSPPTPSKTALNQLIKGCQIAMHQGILSEQENKQLRAENEKTKKKRARTQRRVAHEGGISVGEAQELFQLVEQPNQAVEPVLNQAVPPVQSQPEPPRRRLPTCGKCRNIGHKSNACPER